MAEQTVGGAIFKKWCRTFLTALAICFTAWTGNCLAQSASASPATNTVLILGVQGAVEVLPAGATTWTPAQNHQVLHPLDRIHTAENSRMALLWSDQSVMSFGASTELEILPPDSPGAQSGLHLFRGVISFFHRDQPGRIRIITRGAVAGVEGTEFVLAVNDADTTTMSVVDGKVKFGNAQATLALTNGQQAVAELGRAPVRTAGFIANNLLQWCFYYPAVLDPAELALTTEEQSRLDKSLAAYRSGDLLAALAAYPTNLTLTSDSERLYHAALLLSVGQVMPCEAVLADLSATNSAAQSQRLATALRQLIAAVKRQPPVMAGPPQLASELLAQSYFEQSRAVRETSLETALALAKSATRISPDFGFAWERVAELELCFGRTKDSLSALNRSLELAPRNPQALALKGFILSAQNEPRAAITWFDRAIGVDAALGNAWLGRGLARIRIGDTKAGREDLLVAAALEPQRAELRSYLGKAYIAAGDDAHATKELNLAKKLDPKDPTAWLYSALQKQQGNQINDAIRDLETSQQLNNNRSVYRSQLLLDQDQAVRAADLASIYGDAGMTDVSVREAGRAVSYDYANYSAHLFLGNSYDQLRDPNWSNLRYETPAVSEYWIANLLAPASAGVLSPLTAQQPYTKLFDQNRVGVVSDTTYLSRGSWAERGAQFGTYDDFSYEFAATYLSDNGQRVNNDSELRNLSLTIKYQITPQDTVFADVAQLDVNSGDVNQYYNQKSASRTLRVEEPNNPSAYFGYHHDWSPGSHTLFFAGYLDGQEKIKANNVAQSVAAYDGTEFNDFNYFSLSDYYYKISPQIYSAELQQIFEGPEHTTVVGTRYQWGNINYQVQENSGDTLALLLFPPEQIPEILNQNLMTDFHRLSFYGYHNWQILDSLQLVGGLTYDDLYLPANATTAPASAQQKTIVQFSPKAGFIWNPVRNTILRAAYTRSLSGAVNDQSISIEPTEVAGFNQAYRSLVPESAFGNSSGADMQTYDVAIEQKFDTGTYLSLAGQFLESSSDQSVGTFIWYWNTDANYATYPGLLKQSVDFHEQSLLATADQLLGKQWSVGTRYRLSFADLDAKYPDASVAPKQHWNSTLNEINLHANWNHPCGLFSIFEANWYDQSNSGFSPAEPGQDFWQLNAYAGWRFWHRRAEVTVGLLNITDQGYKLEPLNLYNTMADSRTFMTRLRINF